MLIVINKKPYLNNKIVKSVTYFGKDKLFCVTGKNNKQLYFKSLPKFVNTFDIDDLSYGNK